VGRGGYNRTAAIAARGRGAYNREVNKVRGSSR
jgi:hypothetical protein